MLYTNTAIETIAHLMLHAEKESKRLAAAISMLERSHGKPQQDINLGRQKEMSLKIIHKFINAKAPQEPLPGPALCSEYGCPERHQHLKSYFFGPSVSSWELKAKLLF